MSKPKPLADSAPKDSNPKHTLEFAEYLKLDYEDLQKVDKKYLIRVREEMTALWSWLKVDQDKGRDIDEHPLSFLKNYAEFMVDKYNGRSIEPRHLFYGDKNCRDFIKAKLDYFYIPVDYSKFTP